MIRLFFLCCSIHWTKFYDKVDYDICYVCNKRVNPWKKQEAGA